MRRFRKGDKITLYWDDGDYQFTVITEFISEQDSWINTKNGNFRRDRVKNIILGHKYNTGDLNG